MNSKFIFILCVIFYSCENVFSYKAERSVSLPIKKLQSVTNSSDADGLKANQGKDVFPSQEKIQNVSNYSWGTSNSSSNHTNSLQAYFVNKNIIIMKEKGIVLPHNASAFVEKVYANLSTNVANVSLYGLPDNTTTTGESVQPKMMKTDIVGKFPEKENSTRYANIMEAKPTKESPRERRVRARTDSVESLMDKLFGKDFSEPVTKRQRQSDGSRERNSRRKQKMKKPGRSREGEAFYFRDAETTGSETTASGGEETTTASGEETTTASGEETTTASGGETTTASGGETTTANGGETTTASGEETTVSGATEPSKETPKTGPEGTGPNVNYHYHFHYFGASPPQP